MTVVGEKRLRLLPGILLGILVCVLYGHLLVFKAQVTVKVEVPAGSQHWFKVYWTGDGQPYSERNSSRVRVSSAKPVATLYTGNLGDIDRMRIDPLEEAGEIALHGLRIDQEGYRPVTLDAARASEQLTALNDIERIELRQNRLWIETGDRDGQLELALAAEKVAFHWPGHLLVCAVILLLSIMVWCMLLRSGDRLKFVPWLMLAVATLVLVLAAITRFNVHPDEYIHLAAVDYYKHNVLPPQLDDPAIVGTYSNYGNSRLSSFEAYYPLAGYFTRVLEYFRIPFLLEARLFGLIALAVLVLLVARVEAARPLLLPLLITPQAWYAFSYVNSEGFAMMMALLIAWQVTHSRSLLHRFLSATDPPAYWTTAIMLGVLLGGLLFLKTNYYFYVVFLGLYLVWRLGRGDFPQRAQFYRRLALLISIGLLLFVARAALDWSLNGPQPLALRAEMTEHYASYELKPGTPIEDKMSMVAFRDRGIPLSDLILKDSWIGKTFQTGFGSYGYTQYNGDKVYYFLVTLFALMLLALLFYRGVIRASWPTRFLFLATCAGAGLLVLASLLSSWINEFQPQGRYLLPVLPMFGVLCYHLGSGRGHRVFNLLVICLFALSCYSFIFVGMANLDKTSYVLALAVR